MYHGCCYYRCRRYCFVCYHSLIFYLCSHSVIHSASDFTSTTLMSVRSICIHNIHAIHARTHIHTRHTHTYMSHKMDFIFVYTFILFFRCCFANVYKLSSLDSNTHFMLYLYQRIYTTVLYHISVLNQFHLYTECSTMRIGKEGKEKQKSLTFYSHWHTHIHRYREKRHLYIHYIHSRTRKHTLMYPIFTKMRCECVCKYRIFFR